MYGSTLGPVTEEGMGADARTLIPLSVQGLDPHGPVDSMICFKPFCCMKDRYCAEFQVGIWFFCASTAFATQAG